MSGLQIPDSHVEHALGILKDGDSARARAAHEFAEKQLKTVLAKVAQQSNAKAVSEREQHALASPEYEQALRDYKAVAELYYTAKDRRDAAEAIISAWQTINANNRAMERVR